jgi:hypothetical protein
MTLMTVTENEAAVGAELHSLVWRLLENFRRHGNSLRPGVVQSPDELARLAFDMETVAGDCRDLLRRKTEGDGHDVATAVGAGLAGCHGLAGGHGRSGATAR